MYKAIIFDFFGVIQADPYQQWLNKNGLKREGAFADASDINDRGLITQADFFSRLSELTGQSVEDIRPIFYENKFIDEELKRFIELLKTNYKIGLLSNSRNDYLRPILAEHGIDTLFDEIVISSELGVIKPEPKIFHITLQKMGLMATEVIFIDDRDHNVQSAEALGIRSVLYRDLASLKDDLNKLGIATS